MTVVHPGMGGDATQRTQSARGKPSMRRDAPAEVSGRATYGRQQEADRGNYAGPYVRKLAGPASKPRSASSKPASATRRGTAPVRFMLSPEELQRAIQVWHAWPYAVRAHTDRRHGIRRERRLQSTASSRIREAACTGTRSWRMQGGWLYARSGVSSSDHHRGRLCT